MLNVALKDILIQKKSIIFSLVYSVFLFIVFQNPIFLNWVYSMGAVAVTYIYIVTASTMDDKNNSAILFNSLPVNRADYVKGKYLSAFFFMIISLVTVGLIGAFFKVFGFGSLRFINYFDIVMTVSLIGFYVSVYFPLYFWFGSSYIRIFNMFMFFAAFFGPKTVVQFVKNNWDKPYVEKFFAIINNFSTLYLITFLMLILIVCLLISFILSFKIYRKKDL